MTRSPPGVNANSNLIANPALAIDHRSTRSARSGRIGSLVSSPVHGNSKAHGSNKAHGGSLVILRNSSLGMARIRANLQSSGLQASDHPDSNLMVCRPMLKCANSGVE